MNTQNAYRIFLQNIIFYLMGLLIILGMKYFYSKADCDNLVWILAPIAKWVELLSGIPFEYTPGAGYANHSLRLLIAPSCSGVQFMIITIALLIFSFVHRVTILQCVDSHNLLRRLTKGFCWMTASVVLSYLFTIFVNGLRIIAAIYIPRFLGESAYKTFLTPDRLHTIIGIIIYFTSLLIIYRLTDFFLPRTAKVPDNLCKEHSHKDADSCQNHNCLHTDFCKEHNLQDADSCQIPTLLCRHQQLTAHQRTHLPQFIRKCLCPVFWYFTIALGIPFLNNAYEKSGWKFMEFAFLIVCCCTAILSLYGLILYLGKRLKKGRHIL